MTVTLTRRSSPRTKTKLGDTLWQLASNNMVDHFNSWYFGIAFSFLFKYCTGMPDMPAFAEKERFRRSEDAPRIEPTKMGTGHGSED